MFRLSASGTAAAATVALTQVPASGAFSAVTGSAANSVSNAASFCTAGPTTLYSSGDSWTDAADPTDNNQNDMDLIVRASTSGDRHAWTGFALPAVPARCELAQATNTAGGQEWVVTDHVLAQSRDGNNGFVLRDRRATSTYYQQAYYDRQHTTCTPTLVLTWG